MIKVEFADYYIQQIPKNSQKESVANHINWWNFEKTRRMLREAGFKEIYRSMPQKSRFKEMRGLRKENKF